MRSIYTLLLYLATPFILLRLYWRSLKQYQYRQRIRERFACYPTLSQQCVWVHAVSVGEAHAAFPLIRHLLKTQTDPVVVTTTTPTGSAEILKQFGNQVKHVYTPYDLPSVIKRFLKKTQPKLAIIMETELWPNLLHTTHQANIPLILANARLSERSYRGYNKIRRITRAMLNCFTVVATQTPADAERFKQLGVNPEKLKVIGNIKFDTSLPANLLESANALRAHWQQRPTWIAASTHEGEELAAIAAHLELKKYFPNALLILVPRHPERFPKVAQLLEQHSLNYASRSKGELPNEGTAVYLGDTMGELRLLYAASDIAFVAGSLAPIGGHNPIEPALLKIPVLTGPNTHNFALIMQLLLENQGIIEIDGAPALAITLKQLFQEPAMRQQYAEAAFAVCKENTGALKRLESLINPYANPR